MAFHKAEGCSPFGVNSPRGCFRSSWKRSGNWTTGRQQPLSRRLCGWSSAGLVPSPSTFCRAFTEFAERGFTDRWFADFVREFHGDAPVETVSYDSAPVPLRAKAVNAKGEPRA